jgi:hypothetical protein
MLDVKKALDNLPEYSTSAGAHYDHEPLRICGENGIGSPDLRVNSVCLNGEGKIGMNHENLYIHRTKELHGFCKTDRKPYDLIVCFTLIALANAYNDPKIFTFSSDGNKKDYQPAAELYTKLIGEIYTTTRNIIDNL